MKKNSKPQARQPQVATSDLVRLLQHAYSIYSVKGPSGERMPYLLINFERENVQAMKGLEAMEAAMRMMPGIEADKIAGINAIHTLLSEVNTVSATSCQQYHR